MNSKSEDHIVAALEAIHWTIATTSSGAPGVGAKLQEVRDELELALAASREGFGDDGAGQLPSVIYTDDPPRIVEGHLVTERELVVMDPMAQHPAEMDPRGFLVEDYEHALSVVNNGDQAAIDRMVLPSEARMIQEEEKARAAAKQEHGLQRDPSAPKEYLFLDHKVKCPTCAENAANAELARRQRDGLKAAQRDAILLAARSIAREAKQMDGPAQPASSAGGQEPVRHSVLQIGGKGTAYDPPNTNRAFTYSDQPNNEIAWSLGEAMRSVAYAAVGDPMDRGLSLLKGLQKAGFGVFQIGTLAAPVAAEAAPQAVGLGQFREAVRCLLAHSESNAEIPGDTYHQRIADCMRLLAMIDSQQKESSDG